jgi:hypothetical protein
MRTFLFFASAILPFSLLPAQELGWVSRNPKNIARLSSDGSSSNTLNIRVRDKCDPVTFDAAVAPGACVGNGNVTFAEFIAELTEDKTVGAWSFNPDKTDASVGQPVLLESRGGEVHTFTKVANFGGGIVPTLNTLSGNPVVTPECAKMLVSGLTDVVPPGAMKQGPVLITPGEQKFQCCIHPWMHTVLNVQNGNGDHGK